MTRFDINRPISHPIIGHSVVTTSLSGTGSAKYRKWPKTAESKPKTTETCLVVFNV